MTWLTWIQLHPRTHKCQVTRVPLDLGDALVFPSKKLGRPKKNRLARFDWEIFCRIFWARSPLNAGGLSTEVPLQNAQKVQGWNYGTICPDLWFLGLRWLEHVIPQKKHAKKMQQLWGWRSGTSGWCDFSDSWWYIDVKIPLKTNEYPLNNWWLGSFRWFVSFQIGPFSRGRGGSWWNRLSNTRSLSRSSCSMGSAGDLLFGHSSALKMFTNTKRGHIYLVCKWYILHHWKLTAAT